MTQRLYNIRCAIGFTIDTEMPSARSQPSAQRILDRQDELDSLRLLLAQRVLNRRAKRWSGARSLGYGMLAFAGPLIALIWPRSAEAVGAVAGAWFFLARTLFQPRERHWKRKAAAVQQRFDCYVLELPERSGSAHSRFYGEGAAVEIGTA